MPSSASPPTRNPMADVPLTVDVVPRPAKPVKPDFPCGKQTFHRLMMTHFMGEISRTKLEYASCAGKTQTKSSVTVTRHATDI